MNRHDADSSIDHHHTAACPYCGEPKDRHEYASPTTCVLGSAPAQVLHRYEISALIGPCTMDEAVAMLDRLSDEKSLGAAWAVQQLEEVESHV